MAQVAIAAGAAAFKIIGGLVAASQAKAKAEYFAKQYEEQAKSVGIQYQRSIQRSVGAEATKGMGVSISGSRAASILDGAYTASLDMLAKQQDLYRAATSAQITGQQQATSAISEGIGGAFSSLATGAKGAADSAATAAAKGG